MTQKEKRNSKITSQGIKNELRSFNFVKAISEYIWNGFDANASCIEIIYEHLEIGHITKLQVIDDGDGIPRYQIGEKLDPVFSSTKSKNEEDLRCQTSLPHGKKGYGRFSFFCFCQQAEWETIYKSNESDKFLKYSVKIDSSDLVTYTLSEDVNTRRQTGTTVSFHNIFDSLTDINLNRDLVDYITVEFGWFLALKKYSIKINGEELNYTSNINDSKEEILNLGSEKFSIKYIQWKARHGEASKYYFLNEDSEEICKITTKLNRKSDNFYHCIFVESKFFNNYIPGQYQKTFDDNTLPLQSTESENENTFKTLQSKLEDFLSQKRKPFLRAFSEKLISELETKGILPEFKNEYEYEYRRLDLIEIIKVLYEVEPKLFVRLNEEQKKTFVRLLNLILDSGQRQDLFNIIEEVVELDPSEREEMSRLLKKNTAIQYYKNYKTY